MKIKKIDLTPVRCIVKDETLDEAFNIAYMRVPSTLLRSKIYFNVTNYSIKNQVFFPIYANIVK
jgi:hypothetical protein